jgi:hypothetical protein
LLCLASPAAPRSIPPVLSRIGLARCGFTFAAATWGAGKLGRAETTVNDKLKYHRHLEAIGQADVEYVRRKDAHYDASWKKRDGVGAFFTIVRPWDRLESISRSVGYDIFTKIREEGLEGPDGSLIACVRDLRRYLLLVEAEMTEQLTSQK